MPNIVGAVRCLAVGIGPPFLPEYGDCFIGAALAGVDVRMICTPRGAKFQMPYRAALTYFKEVTEAGVKVYLYDGGYYHAKTINVDGALCTIGSCNMDIRSYDLEQHMKLPFRRRFVDSFCGWPRR